MSTASLCNMRIANAVFAFLFFVGFIVHIVQNPTDNIPYLSGQLLDMAFWISPFYLSWRGLAPDSTDSMMRCARLANISLLILSGFFVVLVLVTSTRNSFLQL